MMKRRFGRAHHWLLPGVTAALSCFLATGCGPSDTDGRLTVRHTQVRATAEDGTVLVAGAVDSTWVVPGDEQERVTRSVSMHPGDDAGLAGTQLDHVLDALATKLRVVPQDEPPGELSGSEARTNWLLEAPLGQGVTFTAQIPTHYVRRPDSAWNGTGTLDRNLHWVVASTSPADTVDLRLQGQFRDLRELSGIRTASIQAEGSLHVASAGGTYSVTLEERSVTTVVSSDDVNRRRDRAREAFSSSEAASDP